MKNLLKAGLFIFLFSMAFTTAQAQIYVNVRPIRPEVIINRPPAPSRGHVWVDEEWVPQGNSYAWHGGYWAAPPRPGAIYVKGYWRHTHSGHVWVSGRWR